MNHTESYIDHSIQTPKDAPSNILCLLEDLDEYDRNGMDVAYYDRLDDLWVNAKNAIAAGVMSRTSWKIIEQKYWIHADEVMRREDSAEKESHGKRG